MYELKKIGKVLASKSVGTGSSSYEKRIYRAAISQMLRNIGIVCDLAEMRAANLLNTNQKRYRLSHHAGRKCMELYLHSLHMSSWRGACTVLKHLSKPALSSTQPSAQ